MDLKKTKRIWIGLVVTFFVGIFALAVQPTGARVSSLDQESNSGKINAEFSRPELVVNRLNEVVTMIGVSLAALLICLIIIRLTKRGGKYESRTN